MSGVRAIFVAGTDTNVGKTIVTGLLGRLLIKNNHKVVTQKWVQTGSGRHLKDIRRHMKLMKRKESEYKAYIPSMAPYTFKFASSPHLAGRLEGAAVKIDTIKKSLACLSEHFDTVIIEGTGGLLVPLDEDRLLIDVIREFRLPVLLVAGNRAGAINHTLLSIEALRSRDIKIIGTIFNNAANDTDEIILKDNPRIVKALSGIEVFGILPHARNADFLFKYFEPIGNKILNHI
ncbi:MAG: dethiobiotin synthase [Candidatus Omnitrophota bacterium]|nr:dethiobiotin synthase [Candidatus Omnitrophota bacterium]